MTHDEVSKACVPTALRATSDLEIDGIYNAAHSHLRSTDEGVIRQMQACISAIVAERVRRQNKLPIALSVIALGVSVCSLGLSAWLALKPPREPQLQQSLSPPASANRQPR
jgi:hypothetical protein